MAQILTGVFSTDQVSKWFSLVLNYFLLYCFGPNIWLYNLKDNQNYSVTPTISWYFRIKQLLMILSCLTTGNVTGSNTDALWHAQNQPKELKLLWKCLLKLQLPENCMWPGCVSNENIYYTTEELLGRAFLHFNRKNSSRLKQTHIQVFGTVWWREKGLAFVEGIHIAHHLGQTDVAVCREITEL